MKGVTTERGFDAGDFTLFAYGGAGPLHAVQVARCIAPTGTLDVFDIQQDKVTPDTVIPPRSFVLGRPGRVTRMVRDDEVAFIRESAAHYVAFARDFREACKRV